MAILKARAGGAQPRTLMHNGRLVGALQSLPTRHNSMGSFILLGTGVVVFVFMLVWAFADLRNREAAQKATHR